MNRVLLIVIASALLACSSPESRIHDSDSVHKRTPSVQVEQATAEPLVPAFVADASEVKSFGDCSASQAPGEGIRPLCLFDKTSQFQIKTIHLRKEQALPGSALLRDAKAYRTQVAPELPFPVVDVTADRMMASHTAHMERGGHHLVLVNIYRRMDGVEGLAATVGADMNTGPISDERVHALESVVRAVAQSLRVVDRADFAPPAD